MIKVFTNAGRGIVLLKTKIKELTYKGLRWA